jgi:hypothetical protein
MCWGFVGCYPFRGQHDHRNDCGIDWFALGLGVRSQIGFLIRPGQDNADCVERGLGDFGGYPNRLSAAHHPDGRHRNVCRGCGGAAVDDGVADGARAAGTNVGLACVYGYGADRVSRDDRAGTIPGAARDRKSWDFKTFLRLQCGYR